MIPGLYSILIQYAPALMKNFDFTPSFKQQREEMRQDYIKKSEARKEAERLRKSRLAVGPSEDADDESENLPTFHEVYV